MRINRLAAAGTACGATALALAAAAPAAWAEQAPQATATVPKTFKPGDNLWIDVTGCGTARPATGGVGLANEIFAENPAFQEEGERWRAIGGTRTDLKPGKTYRTEFRCGPLGRRQTFPLTITVPAPAPTPTPTPEDFEFGFDQVELSTRTVEPGGQVTFTVTCPTRVNAQSASFTKAPEFVKDDEPGKDGVAVFTGTATFKKTLPSIVNIKVVCTDHGHVTYSTKPAEDDLGDGGPKVPKGAPNTGGGIAEDGGGQPGAAALAGAALTLLAGAGLGVRLLRRRTDVPAEDG